MWRKTDFKFVTLSIDDSTRTHLFLRYHLFILYKYIEFSWFLFHPTNFFFLSYHVTTVCPRSLDHFHIVSYYIWHVSRLLGQTVFIIYQKIDKKKSWLFKFPVSYCQYNVVFMKIENIWTLIVPSKIKSLQALHKVSL